MHVPRSKPLRAIVGTLGGWRLCSCAPIALTVQRRLGRVRIANRNFKIVEALGNFWDVLAGGWKWQWEWERRRGQL